MCKQMSWWKTLTDSSWREDCEGRGRRNEQGVHVYKFEMKTSFKGSKNLCITFQTRMLDRELWLTDENRSQRGCEAFFAVEDAVNSKFARRPTEGL